jgi:multidrug efflux pump subunit AcrA (membrane-fusion protein)
MSPTKKNLAVVFAVLMSGGACKHDHRADQRGHDHSDGHGAREAEPLSITQWTAEHELFVEFPPPVAGKTVEFHAHVTKLDGFRPLRAGTFRVRYKTGAGIASEAKIDGVKRPGIFTPEGPAPAAGDYHLEMEVETNGRVDVFDCGSVAVAASPIPAGEPGAETGITFLKEAQWQIPFATEWTEERLLAKEIELPATVEAAGSEQLVIGAATSGRFFHHADLAQGRPIRIGDVIGSIAPAVAGEDYSRLQFAVEDTRLAKAQIEREIRRVEPLVKEQLLPERRLIELNNERDALAVRLTSASNRLARVGTPGAMDGLTIASPRDGVVAEVLVRNGEPVEAGAALVRIRGGAKLWLRSRFVARPTGALEGAVPAAVRLASGERVDFDDKTARMLSALPVVDPGSRLATWIAEVVPTAGKNANALQAGTPLVVLVKIGSPRKVVALPRAAIVEINTRPFVFVQLRGEQFEKRQVALGDADGPFVEIVSGVSKGERLVTMGGFDVHLASLMGSVESHRH